MDERLTLTENRVSKIISIQNGLSTIQSANNLKNNSHNYINNHNNNNKCIMYIVIIAHTTFLLWTHTTSLLWIQCTSAR